MLDFLIPLLRSAAVSILMSIFLMVPIAALADDVACQSQIVPLFARGENPTDFVGLTQDGLEALRRIRDGLRRRDQIHRNQFYDLENLNKVSMLGRINRRNVFIPGPAGGAKSAHVRHFLSGEAEPAFELQVHGLMTESALMGRETADGLRDGSGQIATDKGIAPHRTAFLDEISLGNPIMLAALLSLFNEEERYFMLGNQGRVDTKIETIFSTANYTLAEFVDGLAQVGLGPTAEALLRRISYKPLVWNWLPIRGQEILDNRRLDRDLINAFLPEVPSLQNHFTREKPESIDWRTLWRLARVMVRPSKLLETASREFFRDFKERTKGAIKESEIANKDNPRENPLVYMPTMQVNEARRLMIMETIVTSAMVDFLLSPMAEDQNLSNFLAESGRGKNRVVPQPLYLDIASLWRALYEATSVSMGEAKLSLVTDPSTSFVIEFGREIDSNGDGMDMRQQRWLEQMKAEQKRFADVFTQRTEEYQKTLKDLAPWMQVLQQKDSPFHGVPFERYLIQSRGN